MDIQGIGNRMRDARKKARLTQTAAAAAFKCAQSLISQVENEETQPSIDYLTWLSNRAGVSIDWLITGKEPVPQGEARPAASRPLDEKERGVIATVEDLLGLYGLKDRYALVEVGREGGGPDLTDEEQRLLNAFRRLDRKIQEALLIQAEMTAEGLQKSTKKEPHGGGLMEAV
uniref:Helix-turn-helix domain-containing protein n=1 Tax=Geobacter metallireducens TaxID=28232 RepID=A0A831XDM0_GEOME